MARGCAPVPHPPLPCFPPPECATEHPELCVKPLAILAGTIAGFAPQELRNDGASGALLGDVRSLLETFAALDLGTPAPAAAAAAGTMSGVLTQAKATALGALMSLALAKGTLSDVAAVVRQLLAQVQTGAAAAVDAPPLQVPVPAVLQVCAMGMGMVVSVRACDVCVCVCGVCVHVCFQWHRLAMVSSCP